MGKVIDLDVREIQPFERHERIFQEWEAMDVGDEIVLTNDHDPRPLHYQFMMEHEDEFEWESEEKGPQEWVAHIRKVALPKAA